MKALSIKAPWAYLIVQGVPVFESVDNGDGTTRVEYSGRVIYKDVENRTWKLPKGFIVPQRIAIHVGQREDSEALEALMKMGIPAMSALMGFSKRLPRGALIGEADITDCVASHDSPWFAGPFGFVLANPQVYAEPIPCKGRLGFFELT